jgi:hypothetical protein
VAAEDAEVGAAAAWAYWGGGGAAAAAWAAAAAEDGRRRGGRTGPAAARGGGRRGHPWRGSECDQPIRRRGAEEDWEQEEGSGRSMSS